MIKKINYLFLGLVLMASTVSAQEFGIKGGLNFPSSSAIVKATSGDISQDGSSGYHAGIFAKFKVAIIGINPEVVYSFQSISYQDVIDNVGTIGDITQKSAYLDIPVMLRFYLPFGLNIQAGPQFGFLMSAERVSDALDEDLTDVIAGSNISVNLGLGIDLPFGLDVYGRYNVGLSDISDVAGATSAVKNSVIQVSLAYSIKK